MIIRISLLTSITLILTFILGYGELSLEGIQSILLYGLYGFAGLIYSYISIYLFIYLLFIYLLFDKKILKVRYHIILIFIIAFYGAAYFFTPKGTRPEGIIRAIVIVGSCSYLIFYYFKKWIKFKKY